MRRMRDPQQIRLFEPFQGVLSPSGWGGLGRFLRSFRASDTASGRRFDDPVRSSNLPPQNSAPTSPPQADVLSETSTFYPTRRHAMRSVCEMILIAILLCGCSVEPAPAPIAPHRPKPILVPKAPISELVPDGVVPRFDSVASQLGIRFQRYDDHRGQHRIFEANGGGVALLDFDRDGWLDIFFTNGCRLPVSSPRQEHACRLFRSGESRSFSETQEAAGLAPQGYSTGCASADFDNDGFDDLDVTANGRNSMWQNNGDGTFTDVTEPSGTGDPLWGASAAFGDFNRDGHLDLYVTNYVAAAIDPPELCPTKNAPDGYQQCPPTMFRALPDRLYLSQGDGRFVDVAESCGATGVDGKGLGVVVADFNRDGRDDIFVANDGTPNFLFLNESSSGSADGAATTELRFREAAVELGIAMNGRGEAEACMGVGCGDCNADGWLDVFVTNFFAQTNTLYINVDGQRFEDRTNESKLGPPSRNMVGWGTWFLDFDNNGIEDLLVINGHVDDFSWLQGKELYAMPPQFFRNDGTGRFTDVSKRSGEYFQQPWIGRGLAVGDLNRDGLTDAVISHQRSESAVLLNRTNAANRVVIVELIGGMSSNRSGIGCKVTARIGERRLFRSVLGGGSYQSASERAIPIGLGAAEQIDSLFVEWPSGKSSEYFSIPANGRLRIVEDSSQMPVWDALHVRD